jgi:CubicO group peptidase (beta-lactamase class C family)
MLHLLTHTSGLEHNEGGDMGADIAIQKGLEARDSKNKKVSLPLSTELAMRYGLYFNTIDQPEFTPGADEQYSNFAYSLLGFVLDKYKKGNGDGAQYDAAMREMLSAVGALSGHIHHIEYKDLPADKLPDSLARPHMEKPSLSTTVLDNSGDKVVKAYGGQNWQRGYGAHGYNASAAGLVRLLGTLLASVSATNRPVNDVTYKTLLTQKHDGANHYTLSGFRLPEDGPTYISKSGGEVGTACLTFFPYGTGGVDAEGNVLDGKHKPKKDDKGKNITTDPPKAQFNDTAAVILADTDAGSLSTLGDQLYWLFLDATNKSSWPNRDLFHDGWIAPYKP